MFATIDTLPHVARAGDVFYLIGVGVGIILWGFANVWFIVAVMMIATAGGFPFNMRWSGFIFPVGQRCFASPSRCNENLTVFGRCIHAPNDQYWRRAGVSLLQGLIMRKLPSVVAWIMV